MSSLRCPNMAFRTPPVCCSTGRVRLQSLSELPQLPNSFLEAAVADSCHFLQYMVAILKFWVKSPMKFLVNSGQKRASASRHVHTFGPAFVHLRKGEY